MAQFSPTAGAGTGYSYRAGAASSTFPQAEPEVLEATFAAMEDLSMQTSKEPQRTGTATSVTARAADGRRVRIDLRPQGESTTATVKVGLAGDEPLSKALIDRMDIRLRNLPPSAIPDEIPTDEHVESAVLSRDAVSDSEMLRGFTDSGFGDSPVP
jgi:hypothetical protein